MKCTNLYKETSYQEDKIEIQIFKDMFKCGRPTPERARFTN